MGGGATWSNTFKNGATLDEGTYYPRNWSAYG